MKILFAAPITFDRATFFISQYTLSLAKAAKVLGHEVRVIQTTEDRFNPYLWPIIDREYSTFRNYLKRIADFPHDMLLIKQVLHQVKEYQPDLLFLYLDDTSFFPLAIDKIKKMGVRIFTWRGLSPEVTNPDVIRLLKKLDYIFIYDKSYIEKYMDLGIQTVHIVPMGCDVEFHDAICLDFNAGTSYQQDIVFIGIVDQYREKYLEVLSQYHLGLWTWKLDNPFSPLKGKIRGISFGEHMIKLYKASKIAVNIHRRFEQNGGNYRLFEIPACRTFQLVDSKREISTYFEIGKEIITFDSPDDLKEKAAYFLQHDDERKKIAQAGYERVKKSHSLRDRMMRMIDIMDR